MSRNSLLGLAALLLCAACNQSAPSKPDSTLKADTQTYTQRTCVRDSTCLNVNFSYPVFAGGNPAVAESINAALQKSVAGYAAWDTTYELPLRAALDAGNSRLLESFKAYAKEVDLPQDISWENELKAEVIHQNAKVLSVQMAAYIQMGGAHPSTSYELLSFDLSTGKVIPPATLVKDTTALLPILEAAFRKDKEIPADQTTAEHLLVPRFPMPQNAALVKDGIRFFYNPYEIAAYVYGPTDVLLTWEQLGALADRKLWE
jgi:hypothetical protein